jgi:hypothetical protein
MESNAMTKVKTMVVCSLVAALAACSSADIANTPAPIGEKEAKLLEKELNGKVAGKPVNCISASISPNSIRISDDMLLYRVSGRLVYQNLLRGRCPGLVRNDDVIVTRIFGSQYCRGDIIKLVDRFSGIAGPSCILGDFIPYRKPSNVSNIEN